MSNRISSNQANWYAVYTRSRAEKKLNMLLSQKNVECFLPLKKMLQQRSDRKKWIQQPLIPSYIFVRISEKEQFHVLNTPGAVCFVSFGGRAVVIPENQVCSLANLMANKEEDIEVYHGQLAEGDQVEINSGRFKGLQGEIVEVRGKQRFLLRLESLGYCVHAEISAKELK